MVGKHRKHAMTLGYVIYLAYLGISRRWIKARMMRFKEFAARSRSIYCLRVNLPATIIIPRGR
jgi:hypothetical protein